MNELVPELVEQLGELHVALAYERARRKRAEAQLAALTTQQSGDSTS